MALPEPAKNSTVVVTGASSGIGAELARELARRGYGVTLVARRKEKLTELADELHEAHAVTAAVESADLQDPGARDRLVESLANRPVVGLVNNAGYGATGPFAESDLDWQQNMVQLNCQAVVHLTGLLLPRLIDDGAGAVLNIASLAACQPIPNMATYAASKAFVLAFSEAVHSELAGSGVSVTAVQPGPVKTEFWELAGEKGRNPGAAFVPAEEVARQAVDGMVHGRRTVVPTLKWKGAAVAGRFVPRTVQLPLMKRFGY
jgi:uncharacterized protein